MLKIVFYFFVPVFLWGNCFAASKDIPEATRRQYALKFHEAFILQSCGLSTRAFYLFSEAYQEALKAGEAHQKVIFIEDLFKWYRIHGSAMHLFGRQPTGNDRIVSPPTFFGRHKSLGTHQSPLSEVPDYYSSEWGNTPEQAGKIRECMFGIGNIIAGVFVISIGSPAAILVGGGAVLGGFYMMFTSLNSAYVDFERAELDLKILQSKAKNLPE